MNKELYFLRSSEQGVIEALVDYAYPNSGEDLSIYTKFYGLTTRDLGLYALVDNKIAGAIWSRELNHNPMPIMSLALIPEYKEQNVLEFMMEQYLQEVAAQYEEIQIDLTLQKDLIPYFETIGFTKKEQDGFIFLKRLEKKEVFRPSDGYDPNRWMD